mgnify:CR=1 FL=1
MPSVLEKPSKPYSDFPLFPHAAGQWAKKIKGRMHYFGVWADPDAALRKYLNDRDFLQAGLEPPTDQDRVTIRDLCNHFLTAKQRRLDNNEIGTQTFTGYTYMCGIVIDAFGKFRSAGSIGPRDFTELRSVIAERYGPVRTKNVITQIRSLFNWGYNQELIAKPRYGSEFVPPSNEVLRRHRNNGPARMFEVGEIRAMLEIASVHAHAWLLLGLNGAFIQKDLSDLRRAAVDLDAAVIDFPREKTAVERRVTLWPETVEALSASLARRTSPMDERDSEQFFVTSRGHRLVVIHERGTKTDAVHTATERLQKKLGIKQKKRSFGALRHTFQTIAEETCDFPAVMRVMGHTDPSISGHYRERIEDDRLLRVTSHVRDWLYRNDTSVETPNGKEKRNDNE